MGTELDTGDELRLSVGDPGSSSSKDILKKQINMVNNFFSGYLREFVELITWGRGKTRMVLEAYRCQTCFCKMSVQRALYRKVQKQFDL